MGSSTSQLPVDIASLEEQLAEKNARIADLQQQLRVLRKLIFGPRSEKRRLCEEESVPLHEGYLFARELAEEAERLAAEKNVQASVEVTRPPRPRKKTARRKKFPPDAPVVRTTSELPEDDRRCACGGELHPIGEEVSRELERVEVTVVHELARVKYACRSCQEGSERLAGGAR